MRRKYAKTVEEFDSRIENEDIFDVVDAKQIRVVEPKVIHSTLDLTQEFAQALDRAAAARGVTRQSLIKVWLYEKLAAEVNPFK